MNPAEEEAANKERTERPSAGAVAGSVDKLNEQLRVSAEDLLRPSYQPKAGEDLHELLSAIGHRLDHESAQQKSIFDRLVAIENQTKRRGSHGFASFLLAICIGVAGTLAWQSYGEATKQIIATRAPALGWAPGAKETARRWGPEAGWEDAAGGPGEPCGPSVRVGDAASRTRCADCARERRTESTRLPLPRPGAGAAANPQSDHSATNRLA